MEIKRKVTKKQKDPYQYQYRKLSDEEKIEKGVGKKLIQKHI